MVTVKLMGGMGNQMFQYAMTKTLSHRNNCPLFIDNSQCVDSERLNSKGIFLRPFELNVFKIQGKIVDNEPISKTLKIRKQDRLKRVAAILFCEIANRFSDSWKIWIYERKKLVFDKTLLRLHGNVILQGYFPSYKYFEGIDELVRQDFTFNIEPDEQNREIIEMISSSNSISLHIRHGDYISNEKTKDKFGICSIAYYKRAIGFITKSVKNPRFFIFTNSPDFVKNNLKFNHTTVHITHNSGNKSYEDMRLMSLCKHNIIANSSFSWWGAWLNRNPDKIVVAPAPAFDKLDIKDDDFYPDHWVKLPKY